VARLFQDLAQGRLASGLSGVHASFGQRPDDAAPLGDQAHHQGAALLLVEHPTGRPLDRFAGLVVLVGDRLLDGPALRCLTLPRGPSGQLVGHAVGLAGDLDESRLQSLSQGQSLPVEGTQSGIADPKFLAHLADQQEILGVHADPAVAQAPGQFQTSDQGLVLGLASGGRPDRFGDLLHRSVRWAQDQADPGRAGISLGSPIDVDCQFAVHRGHFCWQVLRPLFVE